MNYHSIIAAQQDFFNSNKTKDLSFRLAQLKKIKSLLKQNEEMLYEAIYKDFKKSAHETYLTELSQVYHEIDILLKKLKHWSKRKRVTHGLANFPGKSFIIPEPLGVTLVIGAWNYPYNLSLTPLVTAIGAGNTVVLKPSEIPTHTAHAMATILNENFDPNFICVCEGGVAETTALLEEKFDKIFFTGSTTVGKIVYQAAAKNLTPVTLELGGKSPTFVLADCHLKNTAKRIVWAKFLNAGQTCIAPDYVLVEKSIEKEFLSAVKEEIEAHYDQHKIEENYLQIINDQNYKRLLGLIDARNLYMGANTNAEDRFISPTVLQNVTWDDPVMQEEIFGPILPVLTFTDLQTAIDAVKARPKPLSCYIYSDNTVQIEKILNEVSFGGGAINDSIMHLTNSKLPFGGVGMSGMGAYHGETGFQSFSHYKSILKKTSWLELPVKYTPYTDSKKKIIKWLMG
ncbi:aldehyde dehydrogenase [Putridiphycobacter roseus]|uniref:Aldehyde dehydrogenase n=1 Tax=Putridiphycobacter roseus TaxID=2219161 RepID=A0A2W1NJZ4_9FLAO|nr:aldehyde dehydrogenase [Putridiphycobacter roseus]PZE15952.1 aldehyde dehydrogenase [Putridiphycobacter roseus]